MKKNFYHLVTATLLTVVLAGFSSCGEGKADQQAAASQTPSLPVISLPVKTLTGYQSYPARIEGVINAEVYAKISGYITDVAVDEGQKVRKGQVLFRLETQSLNQDAAAAKANVNAAQVEVDKLKPLVEKNIISEVQLETAKAKLKQAESAYNSIAANIGYGTIKSPVDGYVGAINLRAGSLVSPSSQTPLTTVSEIDKVYAYFAMNEKEYLNFIMAADGGVRDEKIENLPQVTLILANGEEYPQQGTIETVNSQVNENTGSVNFRAVFDNPQRLLTNGNSATLRVPKTYTDVVVVPIESTLERQGSTYVYQLDADNKATATEITVKDEINNLYIVSDGISKGDRIVAKGIQNLRGTTTIQPQETPFDSIAAPIKKSFR
ncbi:efflux RND transporter periplasmic adaptor subunit [Leeuwenhoekiella parthenopeia]|uniref:Efflux RND transporter periplasmic adaptor subunit n=1 Tax=Leeuwenhoekiella parthenopeia TaxID=2890320 RepID=A0ABS8GPF7_9FLAO|nr:efflux RND transporter periplasmic adaptor subunit [Leeuwenhoekiella parthenopeia]MCC4211862.1 efflux RND transporter periplasmic adaptor subunit [Leeuwenhoekiella parthenopeia]